MVYSSGLKPSPASLCSASWESVGIRLAGWIDAVTVLSDECEDGGGGLLFGGGDGAVGDVGEVTVSSGLAIRSPPSDWDRLRSPALMMEKAVMYAVEAVAEAAPAEGACSVGSSERRSLH